VQYGLVCFRACDGPVDGCISAYLDEGLACPIHGDDDGHKHGTVARRQPSRPAPTGDTLLAAGTANQTKLSGTPVKGPLFEFAPAIDQFVKTHLFGDIFERDNRDWQSRELATVGALSAMPGVEAQLQSHIRIGMNVRLTASQLSQVAQVLAQRGEPDAARRVEEALDKQRAAGGKQ
jgi:4-carboxymuconolactone decarboxylase